jgi:hypothetical protein
MEKSDKQKEPEELLNDEKYATAQQISFITKQALTSVYAILRRDKCQSIELLCKNTKQKRYFYEKEQALNILNKEKESKKFDNIKHINLKQLAILFGVTPLTVSWWLSALRIKPLFKAHGRIKGYQFAYDRQIVLTALANKLPVKYRRLLEKEPTMQTADFIPADTLDIYTLDQLKSKIPGIEAHYEIFNKSEIPEYQEIARMLRGNQKSVNLWGKMVEGIFDDIKKQPIAKKKFFLDEMLANPVEIYKREPPKEIDKKESFLGEIKKQSKVLSALFADTQISFTSNSVFIICKQQFIAQKLMEKENKRLINMALFKANAPDFEIVIIDKTSGNVLDEKDNLVNMKKDDVLKFIRKRLQFNDRMYLRHTLRDHDMKKEHKRFDMSGYDDNVCGDCTLHNLSILNEFADLGIYDYTDYLFLDFYKGSGTLYMQYFKDEKTPLEFDLCGYTTSEIIYFIFQKTIFSGKFKRRRD